MINLIYVAIRPFTLITITANFVFKIISKSGALKLICQTRAMKVLTLQIYDALSYFIHGTEKILG